MTMISSGYKIHPFLQIPLPSEVQKLFSLSFFTSSPLGANSLGCLLFFPEFLLPISIKYPKNLTLPDGKCVTSVFSGDRFIFKDDCRNSSIKFRIVIVRSLLPVTPTIQSSTYLTYLILTNLGSFVSLDGRDLAKESRTFSLAFVEDCRLCLYLVRFPLSFCDAAEAAFRDRGPGNAKAALAAPPRACQGLGLGERSSRKA